MENFKKQLQTQLTEIDNLIAKVEKSLAKSP